MTRRVLVPCVGAYRRECHNLTDTILCADCYAFIDHIAAIYDRRNASFPKRMSPRPKHGVPVR